MTRTTRDHEFGFDVRVTVRMDSCALVSVSVAEFEFPAFGRCVWCVRCLKSSALQWTSFGRGLLVHSILDFASVEVEDFASIEEFENEKVEGVSAEKFGFAGSGSLAFDLVDSFE